MIRLPYFDIILDSRGRGEPVARVFESFVHWGYWPNPDAATGGEGDFIAAMDRLNAEVLSAAGLRDGLAVLDAGCGFGGTLACINERHRGMSLAGVNLDRRQLAVASTQVRAREGNSLGFLEANACRLPFADNSLDRVLAVECIFHFPSRRDFLQEAARVLKPSGRLVLSDFVPWSGGGSRTPGREWIERRLSRGYGDLGKGWVEGDYQAMAAAAGLDVEADRDITRNTLPTYPVVMRILRGTPLRKDKDQLLGSTRWLWWGSWLGLVRYRVLSFIKPRS